MKGGVNPLEGVRGLDLSGEIAGPSATRLLADSGAGMVKVEAPKDGRSPSDHWPPPGLVVPHRSWQAGGPGAVSDADGTLGHAL